MRTWLLLLVLFASAVGPCLAGPAAPVRYDGLYTSPEEEGSTGYLRFYADGTVVTVSSTGTAAQVSKWMDKEHSGVSTGKYTVRGSRIEFRSTNGYGSVDYAGHLEGLVMKLSIHSLINDYRADKTYRFVPCSFPPK